MFEQQQKDKRDSERKRRTKLRAGVAQQGQTGTSRSKEHWRDWTDTDAGARTRTPAERGPISEARL